MMYIRGNGIALSVPPCSSPTALALALDHACIALNNNNMVLRFHIFLH